MLGEKGMIFYNERKQKILEYIQQKPTVTVAELSSIFSVSAVTIRKDLNELSKEGEIARTHGGAVGIGLGQHEEVEDAKELVNIDRKQIVAEKAVQFVEEGNTIIIDAGSTTLALSKLIIERQIKGVTVITNAFNIANLFRENPEFELIFVGGQYRKGILSCVGPYTTKILSMINADKLFLGINGISLQYGISTPNMYEAEVKRAMLASSREHFLLADSSKFGNVRSSKVADIKDIDCLVTDSDIDSETLYRLKLMDVSVY